MAFKLKYTNGKKSDPSSFPFHKIEGGVQKSDSPLDFDWDKALSGAGKGAASGAMVAGPWGAVIGGLAMGAMAGFSEDKEEKPEQPIEKKPPKPEISAYDAARNKRIAESKQGPKPENKINIRPDPKKIKA